MVIRTRRTGQGNTDLGHRLGVPQSPPSPPSPPPPPYAYVDDNAKGARRWTSAVNANNISNHNCHISTVFTSPPPPPMAMPLQPHLRAPQQKQTTPPSMRPSSPPQIQVPPPPPPPHSTIFGGRFALLERLGSGGFGDVFRAEERGQAVPLAVKVEQVTESNSRPDQSFLFHEAKVLQEIHKSIQARNAKLKADREAEQENGERETAEPNPDAVGITKLKYYGQDNMQRVLIMSLHGHSVETVHRRQGRLSLFATVMIADQLLSSLEHVHRAGYVHADLKPDNILFGRKDPEQLYLVDFGLSVRYRDREGKHRPLITNHSFVGTPRYASLRTHMGYTLSRRDDIEQLVYVMIYLFRGRLPWSGLRIDDPDAKEKRIAKMKANISLDTICAGCPEAFRDVLNYARCMEFEEEPQYEYLHLLLFSLREACMMGAAGETVCAAASQPAQQLPQPQQPVQANVKGRQGDKRVERTAEGRMGDRQSEFAMDPNIFSGGGNDVEGDNANPLLSGREDDAPAFFSDAVGQGILSANAADTGPLSPRIDCLNDGRSSKSMELGTGLGSPVRRSLR
ncbi:casein kinase I-like protein [Leptomonas pyrrhocoris]|uniref:non-specific serine/threonine protein kinase n=1 Tax=Leptomonas pyrrhocoris TaxID=157538 RepID=A0A0M9G812_LEPPY|nr:casein kinase I-like protein [Leptomonas pyrrhocoris]KPA84326.1 casein kinase I-like protein [Leptomonas pyrrhocoris]|eukprot:XP_015662765.1 casein kinase I-like protein [Leptomonas pyrrhocoris]